ncbi:MAG: hypothetical protein R3342_10700 [Lutibacter sp.]|uniref:hypothetical protein n=1 Tax=Lutibacter sp. TaxID=1925666 RepID=UPI00299E848C|nr:hypothetical protein [Lutibacter sp.]MDX1830002.1 hypothetical protein [Lutibacter sp.]
MKKSVLNRVRVKSLFNEKMKRTHAEELGLNVPSDYFSNSKHDILNQVSNSKVKVLYSKRNFLLPIAAAVALIITLTVFKPSVFSSFNNVPAIVSDTINKFKTNNLANENNLFNVEDVSVAALFVEDDKIDEFVNDYVLEDVIKDVSLKN